MRLSVLKIVEKRNSSKWSFQVLFVGQSFASSSVRVWIVVITDSCFAAYDIRSIDELSGCTTPAGRLGYIRPATAYTIRLGGTAEMALRYAIITASTARPISYKL